jgi:hypothetical protein
MTRRPNLRSYLSRSQPALPVLGMQTFAQTEPTDLAAKGVSYALLTSLIAHATSYASRVLLGHSLARLQP